MDDLSVVAERGVLTAPAEVWQLAVRRAEVIGRLAGGDAVGHAVADTAAAELGISRRQVYELLRRWRAGSGVVSDLVPGKSSGGRGREQLPGPVEAVIRGEWDRDPELVVLAHRGPVVAVGQPGAEQP